MERISSQPTTSQSLRILNFCCVVRRSLTLEEMREALSIEIGQKSLEKAKLPNDMNRAVAACRGLVYVDEQDDTIHFLHHSVKQYLSEPVPERSLFVRKDLADHDFGYLCLTYLNFSDFERQILKQGPSTLKVEPLGLGLTAVSSQHPRTAKMTKNILKWRNKQSSSKAEIETRAMQSLTRFSIDLADRWSQHSFLGYVREQSIHHVRSFSPSGDVLAWQLFCNSVERLCTFQDFHDNNFQLLYDFIVEHDHGALMRYILNRPSYLGWGRGRDLESELVPLLVRASSGKKHDVRLVLTSYLTASRYFDETFNEVNHETFVKDMLSGSRAETASIRTFHSLQNGTLFLRAAFCDAVESKFAELVAWLLIYDTGNHIEPDIPNLLVQCIEWLPHDAILTICARFPGEVERLIRDVPHFLDTAVRVRSPKTAEALLGCYKPSPSLTAQTKCDPLLLRGIQHNNFESTRAILRSGIPPDAVGRNSASMPIYVAIRSRNTAMLEVLLEYGADPTIVARDGSHPFVLACELGQSKMALAMLGSPQIGEYDVLSFVRHAVAFNLCEVVKELIARRGYRWSLDTGFELLCTAIRKPNLEMTAILLDDCTTRFPLTEFLGPKFDPFHKETENFYRKVLMEIGAQKSERVALFTAVYRSLSSHRKHAEIQSLKTSVWSRLTDEARISLDEAFTEYS